MLAIIPDGVLREMWTTPNPASAADGLGIKAGG